MVFLQGLQRLLLVFISITKLRFFDFPVWAHLYITRRCNLKCNYCFTWNNHTEELSTEGFKKVIDKLCYLGTRVIAFMGGEPTLRKDLFELISHACKKGLVTHISTNGTLLTPDYIDKLGKSGIDLIHLSVDSIAEFNESKKDFSKGGRILDDLINAGKTYGFMINVHTVITKLNIKQIIPVVKKMHMYEIPLSIGFIIKDVYGRNHNSGLFFDTPEEKEELFRVLDEIIRLKKNGHNIIDPVQYFQDIKTFCTCGIDWNCGAGKQTFSIDSDGKILMCGNLKPEDYSVFDIDRDFFNKIKDQRRKRLSYCKKICLCNCYYTTTYFFSHPLSFIKQYVIYK